MLILASKSTARQDLLRQAAISFTAEPAAIDERQIEQQADSDGAPIENLARLLACQKALAIYANHPTATIIGADQTLVFENQLLHKPIDMQAAREQLWHLRGKTHHLISAVALVQKGQVIWHHQETARMTMRAFDPSDLDGVLEAEGPGALESVGAYRLEGPSVRLFEKIVGDYFAILGLPLLPLLAALRLHAPNLMNDNKPIKI